LSKNKTGLGSKELPDAPAWVAPVCQVLEELPQRPPVVLEVLLVLAVHGLHLPGCWSAAEQRGDEELGEAVAFIAPRLRSIHEWYIDKYCGDGDTSHIKMSRSCIPPHPLTGHFPKNSTT
jgi:hypothetical protein